MQDEWSSNPAAMEQPPYWLVHEILSTLEPSRTAFEAKKQAFAKYQA